MELYCHNDVAFWGPALLPPRIVFLRAAGFDLLMFCVFCIHERYWSIVFWCTAFKIAHNIKISVFQKRCIIVQFFPPVFDRIHQ